jgi:CubicO group peptidase (beta-lactamase class C family)
MSAQAPGGIIVNEGELGSLLQQHALRHSVPGAAIGILREGAVTTAYHGVADIRTGEPVTAETLFSVGSMTKSMVATVIAQLEGAGRLILDDPVTAHVPELSGSGWAQGASLRDLLANRSGLPLRDGLEFGFADRPEDDDGALSRLTAEIAAGSPMTGVWSYTNLGWCVLGRVIETVTGVEWEESMRRQLFDRAGMNGTAFATTARLDRRACGHEITAGVPVPVEPLVARAYGPAGTSAVSTVADLLRFAALQLADPSLAKLRTVHADVAISGWFDSWGLGLAHFDWAGSQVWGWDGLINGERSVLRILPDRQAAVVLLTNGSTGRAMYRSLFTELMASAFQIGVPPLHLEASPGPGENLSRFEGTYAWPDRRVEVSRTMTGLRIASEHGSVDALPLDDRTFLVDPLDPDNPTVTFGAFDPAGRPRALYLMLWALPRR